MGSSAILLDKPVENRGSVDVNWVNGDSEIDGLVGWGLDFQSHTAGKSVDRRWVSPMRLFHAERMDSADMVVLLVDSSTGSSVQFPVLGALRCNQRMKWECA
jgi:hypothetical protein